MSFPRAIKNPVIEAKEEIQRIAGTFVPDSDPLSKLSAWLQAECRSGSLSETVKKFSDAQPEELDPAKVLIDKVTDFGLECRIPAMISDRESPHPFRIDVEFELQLPDQVTVRRGD